ncbi:DltD domain-containing protein [Colletotrichum sojae]|uniref:DltD domain-containing protein n=1 Tax=Colletotrichum sojae TaxID=2175907 RepID=A0A8H6JH26_9PEZI|nr:DltD domain-containing protein [Colletotrichum sojae]
MVPASGYRVVECQTIDGTIISAWFYEAKGPAPAIIMSHGFNCVKEMALPEVAENLHAKGYNVLFYDARSVGGSGGSPRNLIDPLQMAEDLSDIYTYVSRLPSVDASKIVLWGLSMGAIVSACSAAVDHRPKAVVMIGPLFSFVQPQKRDKAFAKVIQDRVAQLRGNPPHEIAPFTPRGDNPIGMAGAGGPGGLESYAFMRLAKEKGAEGFRDRIALQTYHKLALFRPMEYMDMIKAPILMVVPELDDVSAPEEQKMAFSKVAAPGSKLYVAPGKGHLNIVTGQGSVELVEETDEFIRSALAGHR